MALRVLLLDDHAIVREGYRSLLSRQPGGIAIREAGDAEAAWRLCLSELPDVVVIDLSMPGVSGIETIARLRRRWADLRILVLTMHQDSAFAVQAFRAGANGYVTKSAPPQSLVDALQEVQAGRRFVSADVAQALALQHLGAARASLEALTPREFEILGLLMQGLSPAEIGTRLHLSPKTVGNVHYLVKRKLGVESDIELTRLALRLGVVGTERGDGNAAGRSTF